MSNAGSSTAIYCNEQALAYLKYKTEFASGCGLHFDKAYRLAHLPLVAPSHPLVISTKPGSSYNNGIHDLSYSIAIPISTQALFASKTFISFLDEIKSTSFSNKLSWETFEQRKHKLHATLCGNLPVEQVNKTSVFVVDQLREIGPVAIKVRGCFSGNVNIGRLYLKVYPEQRQGKNICHEIQNLFHSSNTDLYVVGLFNFLEELNATEASELEELINRWWDIEFVQLTLNYLWLLKSKDDLVLDGGIDRLVPLV